MKFPIVLILISALIHGSLSAGEHGKMLSEILEREIHAWDTMDSVAEKLRKENIKFGILDLSAQFNELSFLDQLPKVEEDLLRIVVYEIDLRRTIGVIYQFNHKKELCGYVIDLKFDLDDREITIDEVRVKTGEK